MNHPRGPFAWMDAIGSAQVLRVLDGLHDVHGEERYRARRCCAPDACDCPAGTHVLRRPHGSRDGRMVVVWPCSRPSSASWRTTATTCGASSSPRSGGPTPTTASRRPSWPRCAPTPDCVPDSNLPRVGADDRPPQGAGHLPRAQAQRRCRSRTCPRSPITTPSCATARCGQQVRALPPKQRGAILLRYARRPLARARSPRALRLQRGGRAALAARGPEEAARSGGDRHEARRAPPSSTAPPPPPQPRASPRSPSPTSPTRSSTRRSARSSPRNTRRGLACLAYADHHGGVDACSRRSAPASRRASSRRPARLDEVRRELDEYFEGRRRDFDLAIDSRSSGRRSPGGCCRRPRGSRSARRAPTATWRPPPATPPPSRAAGNALGHNPIPIVVPCHRVLRTGGSIGGYTGGLDRKSPPARHRGHRAIARMRMRDRPLSLI